MLGYVVGYQTKDRLFFREEPGDNFSERKKMLMNGVMLSRMLQQPVRYLVHSAVLVDMEQYRLSHPGEVLETVL